MQSLQHPAEGAIGRRLGRPEIWISAAVAICWALGIGLVLAGRSDLVSHDAILDDGRLPVLVAIPVFLVIWQLMTGAIMLPSILPVVRVYARISSTTRRRSACLGAFIGAYFVVWTLFALLALAGDTAIHLLVDRWGWLAAHEQVISGTLLIGAGIFQLTPLKERCLTECRNPLQWVWRRYRPGVPAAWRLCVANAIYCLGCCWALMLLVFGVAVGSVTLMAVLGGVMVAEKTWSWGARLVPLVSASLVGIGVLVSLLPDWVARLPALP